MATDVNVKNLVINRLSKTQYESAVKNEDELWLTPDTPATTTELGPVKVDGTTITVDADGTIHGTNQTIVDSSLSSTSTNPVQNKVITTNMVKGVTGSGATVTVTKGDDTTSTFTIDNVTNASKATYDSNGDEIAATYAKSSALALVATSGSYNDLSNKPTIPTVNNATLTIQKNGTTVETFTANSSANKTANIVVPTTLSEFTDDLGSSPTHTHSQYATVTDTVTSVAAGTSANQIDVTKNGSTSTITINNVANATNATKATQDGDGNVISSTYLPLTGGTLTGNLNIPKTEVGPQLAVTNSIQLNSTSTDSYCGFQLVNRKDNKSGILQLTTDTDGNTHFKMQRNDGTVSNLLLFADKAVANGVASLDANTKVPVAQIPDLSSTYSTVANTVTGVTAGSTSDKISVTKNGTTSTITINNVANATNATKATQDASGNVITTTYATKAENAQKVEYAMVIREW